MTDSNDISKLFKHIGVSGADYQEINRENGARHSQSRWPLLNSLHAQANRAPEVDTRRRYDMDSDTRDAQLAAAPADDALFTHIATDDIVQAHEEATLSVTEAADVDRRATNAAMAAVDAAPAPSEPAPDTPIAPKVAEFIAPRANLLGGHLRPSAHRAPFDPSTVDGPVTARAAPVSPAAASRSPAPAPMSIARAAEPAAPVASAPVDSKPQAQLAARPFTTVASPSGIASVSAHPAAARPTAQPTAAPAALGGLFARLAHPEGPPADAPTEPVAQAAPVSLFDRLIRS